MFRCLARSWLARLACWALIGGLAVETNAHERSCVVLEGVLGFVMRIPEVVQTKIFGTPMSSGFWKISPKAREIVQSAALPPMNLPYIQAN